MSETVKVELEVPVNVYRAMEYICSLDPVKDIKEYMVWCLEADAEGMVLGDWAEHNDFINERIKTLLHP